MQFFAQVLLRDVASSPAGEGLDVLLIFMCQNDPGLCDDWDPTSGGNRALLVPLGGLGAAAVPAQAEVLLPEVSGIDHVMVEGDSYEEACGTWSTTRGRPQSEVLGGLGGSPAWLQNDETPSCPACAQAMGFVAHFEEGHDHRTAANFGGGRGYGFACPPCRRGAFLWQC